ncbi:MAG TPA: hypothetical protein VGK47_14195 [Nitrososphaeraceae archaeon]
MKESENSFEPISLEIGYSTEVPPDFWDGISPEVKENFQGIISIVPPDYREILQFYLGVIDVMLGNKNRGDHYLTELVKESEKLGLYDKYQTIQVPEGSFVFTPDMLDIIPPNIRVQMADQYMQKTRQAMEEPEVKCGNCGRKMDTVRSGKLQCSKCGL